MANYYGYSRTNYFKVTDEDRLREIVEEIPEAEFYTNNRDEKAFAFGAYGTLDFAYDEDGNDYEVAQEIQKILPDGEVCVIQEVGYEKLRYLIGVSLIITNKDMKVLDLKSLTRKSVEELSSNKHNFELDY